MKVNKKLTQLIRDHKELCESSEIHCIITDEYNETFSSDFSVSSFRDDGNFGRKSKTSCELMGLDGEWGAVYYDLFKKIEITLFPSHIRKIIWKCDQPNINDESK